MKRIGLVIGMFSLLAPLSGCGGDAPPPADGSNLPGEVQEYEKRHQAQLEKINPPKAPTPTRR